MICVSQQHICEDYTHTLASILFRVEVGRARAFYLLIPKARARRAGKLIQAQRARKFFPSENFISRLM
jgi:hypothetical protein